MVKLSSVTLVMWLLVAASGQAYAHQLTFDNQSDQAVHLRERILYGTASTMPLSPQIPVKHHYHWTINDFTWHLPAAYQVQVIYQGIAVCQYSLGKTSDSSYIAENMNCLLPAYQLTMPSASKDQSTLVFRLAGQAL